MKKIFLALICLTPPFLAAKTPLVDTSREVPSWQRHVIDIETGLIWNIGSNTPISYRIAPTQISWRLPYVMKKDFSNGSKLIVRSQFSLIGDWIESGPEDYYFGVSGAPSIEWWSADDRWSTYFSIGGGVGFTNSTEVVGGQGQDFTLNWFAKTGIRYQFNQDIGIYGGAFFQHLSNGGQTDPNPGVDALGFTVGLGFSF